jgi:NAD(P)-dependent dehydrogenase (short-subunit alcohol dehydrogenase family)
VRALVTGGAGGIGRAIVVRLEAEGYDVESLDLVDGFDVSSAAAWAEVGPVDLACLNAGVLTGETDIRALTEAEYRRAVGVNVDGVVFGVRRLAQVMGEGAIVVTASLAGLTGMPSDAIYSLTKHALVGFVRSVASQLAPVTINAVCPGIADTPMIDAQRAAFASSGFPLVAPEAVADAVWQAASSVASGEAWFVQPGRAAAPFRFPTLPGPRREGDRVGPPPLRPR